MNRFYITTPIYYINDVPHIGHTCTTVAADIIARLHRQMGDSVFFLTGTDEHGQKVAEVAEKEGLSPKDYCDKIAPKFENAWKNLEISNDFFIRTTDSRHEKVVAEVLQKIFDNGDVYKGKYEGYYCIGCEKYLTETDMVDGACPLHPKEKTVFRSEDNWFFKLSKYVPNIIELIENEKTNYIFPEGKRLEILAKLKAGVRDISISRENVEWGIQAPWDTKQTIYVWIEALLNYYSATQFVENKKEFWPANLHLLGKEILWFHTAIWQAILMSAGLPLPQKTFTHSFYMIDGNKMSKSQGNVISPDQLVELFGAEASKYLIARSFPGDNDSDVGVERFKEKYNADLANNFGNLVSRIANLALDYDVKNQKVELEKQYIELIDNCRFDEAIGYIFDKYINKSNEIINQVTPWKLEKNDPKRVEVLNECIKNIQIASCHLKPIMPNVVAKIDTCFDNKVKKLEAGLFPRIK